MLDYKIYTFLELCNTMNYRITAEHLQMTQPAVTQQVHALETEYNCKLFIYEKRKLEKTRKAEVLESYARSMIYTEKLLNEDLLKRKGLYLRLGATKSIEYILRDMLFDFLADKQNELMLIIDNTQNLLKKLERNELDFALIEGAFDRNKFDAELLKKVEFVGICAKDDLFAGKEVIFDQIFQRDLIIREEGSGTREILEQVLMSKNYGVEQFPRAICINSFTSIKDIVAGGIGISFVYKSVAESDSRLATFTLKNNPIERKFHMVTIHENWSLSQILCKKEMMQIREFIFKWVAK